MPRARRRKRSAAPGHIGCHAALPSRAFLVVKPSAIGTGRARESSGGRRPSSASSDHWKRLLRRPPREPVALDAQAYVEELNRRLQADSAWSEDTRFILGPRGEPTWDGPEMMKPVVARIVKSMVGEYETEQPFLFDR